MPMSRRASQRLILMPRCSQRGTLTTRPPSSCPCHRHCRAPRSYRSNRCHCRQRMQSAGRNNCKIARAMPGAPWPNSILCVGSHVAAELRIQREPASMPVRRIYSFADPVLRQKARPVGRIDKATQRLIDDMIETMRAAEGIGLAAPQIGVPERLYVAELDEQVYVFINPQIVSLSQETEVAEEGCLSLPGYRGAVERLTKATVRRKN